MAVLTAMVSVHTDDPGETGANEVASRKSVTFAPDGAGTNVVFDLEAGEYTHVGLWSTDGAWLGSTGLGVVLDVAGALILGLTLAGSSLVPPVDFTASQVPLAEAGWSSGTFSYWEKRRKNFGPENPHRVPDLMPFYLQSVYQGVAIVRYPDGVISPVEVVTEELEAIPGVKIYWGGKDNPVTEEEAEELASAGYADYLNVKIEDAYNQGVYGEGNYGA
jgi:hypothetical protein